MSGSVRILAFAGSARSGSFNKMLVKIAAAGAEAAGVPCTTIDLGDYPLPVYDADLEAEKGLPPNASALQELFTGHQGLLVSSPEYNSSISPLLKNTIDWVSRPPATGARVAPLRGKVAGIMAASPGPLGGLRGLVVVRSLLANMGCTVLADQVTIRAAHEAFTAEGDLGDESYRARVQALGAQVARWVSK